jgi:hypothetical protein
MYTRSRLFTGISVGLVGLLILGLLGLGGMLVFKWLGGGGGQPVGMTPGGQARTPTPTKTTTPAPTLIPTVTPTLVVVAQASPTSTPSPTPTRVATMPRTGEGPLMNLILGIGFAALMAAARMARLR